MGIGVKTKITGVGVSTTVTVIAGVASGDSTNGAIGVSVAGGGSMAIIVCVAATSAVAATAVAKKSGVATGDVGAKGSNVGVAKGSNVGVAKGSTVGNKTPGVGVATALISKGGAGVATKESTTGEGVGVGSGVKEGVGVTVGKGVNVGAWVGSGVNVGVAVETTTCSAAVLAVTVTFAADHEVIIVVLLKVAPARKGPRKGVIFSVFAIISLVSVNR